MLKPKQLHLTPAEAPPLTAAKCAELLQQYTEEMGSIREQIRSEQPLALPPPADAAKRTFYKNEVALLSHRHTGFESTGAGAGGICVCSRGLCAIRMLLKVLLCATEAIE